MIDVTYGSFRFSLEALTTAIGDLVELAEPIQIYVNLHRGHGPLSRVKNALAEWQLQRHREIETGSIITAPVATIVPPSIGSHVEKRYSMYLFT